MPRIAVRRRRLSLAAALVFLLGAASGAVAELQRIETGGALAIRARLFQNTFNAGDAPRRLGRRPRVPESALGRRATGQEGGVTSLFNWDKRGPDRGFTEIRAKLHLRAEFSGGVGVFAELYSYRIAGGDFRADYLTGAGGPADPGPDVSMLQAYVELDEAAGLPLRIRAGRQQLRFGRGWLIASRGSRLQEYSFDGLRLTHAEGPWMLDLYWARLAESAFSDAGGDTDLAGVHAEWRATPALALAAYWHYLRDGRTVQDTHAGRLVEWAERLAGVDQYPTTTVHTLGLHLHGAARGWDYFAEAAVQHGAAATLGQRFRFPGGVYGDDRARYDGQWAADAEIGRRFESLPWAPRFFAGGAYFSGDDRRGVSFQEWLNPFRRPRASVAFNRMFSETYYAPVIIDNTHMSNFRQLRAGAVFKPGEAWTVQIRAARFRANATFDMPLHFDAFGRRIFLFPGASFLTRPAPDRLGDTLETTITYAYTEDLAFTLYWGRLFTRDGLGRTGNFIYSNATDFSGGSSSTPSNYITFLVESRF